MIEEAIGLRDRIARLLGTAGDHSLQTRTEPSAAGRQQPRPIRARLLPPLANARFGGPARRLPRKWSMTLHMSKNAAVQYQISYKFH